MLLVENIGQLLTMVPLHREQRFVSISDTDLGIFNDAWLLINEEGRVENFGEGRAPELVGSIDRINAKGCLVTPGLVDCHTHPIYSGDRSGEFAQRIGGKSYQEIAALGGGIRSTIAHSRSASDEDLMLQTQEILRRFSKRGVTTVECKTGYGQNPQEELRMLRALKTVQAQAQQHLKITYLGLHARPDEYESNAQFVAEMSEVLDVISSEGLAEFVDAFVEKGYFEPEECESYILHAQNLGLKVRIHADEFEDSNAAFSAARWKALSADHLECASEDGIRAMATAGVTAVLLPGTSLYSKIPYTNAQPFLKHQCSLALATDYNPGSCRIDNLSMVLSLGALHCGIDLASAIAAVTIVPAHSLGMSDVGHLDKGAWGDLVVHSYKTKEQWVAGFGLDDPRHVLLRGKVLF